MENPQIVFSWEAPLRAYKKRSAGILRFYAAVALLLSLIVFFVGEKILVLPIWAIVFLFYVLTITPPPVITNKITKFGIETAGSTYRFEHLSHFYFIKRFDYDVLVIVGKPPYYYHVYLVMTEKAERHKMIQMLSEHLIYQEHPQKTLTDKLAHWLTELMPQEEKVHIKEPADETKEAAAPPPSHQTAAPTV